jgi:hypothetical protein
VQRLTRYALACLAGLVLTVRARAQEQTLPTPMRWLDIETALVSDWGHSFVPVRARRAPSLALSEPPKPRRAVTMMAAGAGLALGATVAMAAAANANAWHCAGSRSPLFWAGGLTALTGLSVTFAGWGEWNRVPPADRSSNRLQRTGLALVTLGSALLGAAPILLQRPICAARE